MFSFLEIVGIIVGYYITGIIIYILLGLLADWVYVLRYGKYTYDKFKLYDIKLYTIIGSIWPIMIVVFFWLGLKHCTKVCFNLFRKVFHGGS